MSKLNILLQVNKLKTELLTEFAKSIDFLVCKFNLIFLSKVFNYFK